jgi:hypothetical protein
VLPGDREHLHISEGLRPRADESVGLVDMRNTVGVRLEAGIPRTLREIVPVASRSLPACCRPVFHPLDLPRV